MSNKHTKCSDTRRGSSLTSSELLDIGSWILWASISATVVILTYFAGIMKSSSSSLEPMYSSSLLCRLSSKTS